MRSSDQQQHDGDGRMSRHPPLGNHSIPGSSTLVEVTSSNNSATMMQPQQQEAPASHRISSSHSTSSRTPFFADYVMDLSEAHDLAETPDADRPRFDPRYLSKQRMDRIRVPSLTFRTAGTATTAAASLDVTEEGDDDDDHDNVDGNNFEDDDDVDAIRSVSSSSLTPPLDNRHYNSAGRIHTPLRGTSSAVAAMTTSTTFDGTTEPSLTRITNFETDVRTLSPPRSPPRWPRDIPWAIAFWIVVPASVLWPLIHRISTQGPTYHGDNDDHSSRYNPLWTPAAMDYVSVTTLHTLVWSAGVGLLLSRFLYRTPGGGEGDDQRHVIAAAISATAPLSLLINVILTLLILYACPRAKLGVIIPIWFSIRDCYVFRRWRAPSLSSSSSSSWQQGGYTPQEFGSRQAFFQVLAMINLDILSRSLRRVSLLRMITVIFAVQVCVMLLWRWTFILALGPVHAMETPSRQWMMLMLVLIGWKWVTGFICRLLTLLASGGVMSWLNQQATRSASSALADVESTDTMNIGSNHGNNNNNSSSVAKQQQQEDAMTGGRRGMSGMNNLNRDEEQGQMANQSVSMITEAYRTVDASVYQSVADMDDDLLDDDYELDDDEFFEAPSSSEHARRENNVRQSTVKSILTAGITVSFGSVAHCGLLGGLAQFVWSQIRKVEYSQRILQRHGGFQGMAIGTPPGRDITWHAKLWSSFMSLAREFVQRHSDLAMCHVAAYHKSYPRAARDVAMLVSDSGIEPILHDDISTHMCSCVGGTLSGLIVIMVGSVLQRQRRHGAPNDKEMVISDHEVVVLMIVSYVLSYTLLFTILEPLRAAIKATYVSFAQHPESLSRSFPIVYHRLQRLASNPVNS